MSEKSADAPGSSTSTVSSLPAVTIRSPTKASVSVAAEVARFVAPRMGLSERKA